MRLFYRAGVVMLLLPCFLLVSTSGAAGTNCTTAADCSGGWACQAGNCIQDQGCFVNVCDYPDTCDGDICYPAGGGSTCECGTNAAGACKACQQEPQCDYSYQIDCPTGYVKGTFVIAKSCVRRSRMAICYNGQKGGTTYIAGSAQSATDICCEEKDTDGDGNGDVCVSNWVNQYQCYPKCGAGKTLSCYQVNGAIFNYTYSCFMAMTKPKLCSANQYDPSSYIKSMSTAQTDANFCYCSGQESGNPAGTIGKCYSDPRVLTSPPQGKNSRV